MTLVELRRKFVELSGRYDLVSNTSTWADAGANFFINSGQNMLDRMVETPETNSSIFLPLAINAYSLMFQFRCRSIKEVWINTTKARWLLEKISLKNLKEYYSGLVSAIDVGEALYWAPANLRALETSDKVSLGIFLNYTHAETDTKYDYRGVIIAPPVDQACVVEIWGNFYQPTLTTDAQNNYWTVNYPELLLKAALYQLEVFYRNTEGAKDWMNAIQFEASEIEKDLVEEEVSDIDDMGD